MLEELNRYVVATPQPFALDLEKCEGMTLVTVDGQRLIDWAGYYGSKLLGHNHPGLYEPGYLRKLARAANNKTANPDFLTQDCLDYYRMLFNIAPEAMKGPGLEVYAVNSGAEAVENMMKYLVAQFNNKRMRAGRPITQRRFLYFDKAFHGRTVFALNVTQTIDPVATRDFHGLLGGNIMLPFPAYDSGWSEEQNQQNAVRSLQQVESALSLMCDEIVGIIVEPIQGAGGQRVAIKEFFQGLSQLANQYNVYLAFDEVQTGLGATGKMWGIDHFNLPYAPMAVASGKKFGNGVVFMKERLDDIGVLDSTWGGTLVDMVRVLRELEIITEERLIERAAVNGEYLAASLHKLVKKHSPKMFNVRGLGLYQGFSMDTPERKAALVERCLEDHNLLLLGAGKRSIRTRPNLNVTQQDIDTFVSILDEAIGRL
jgi:L-lysine 6-transaminase